MTSTPTAVRNMDDTNRSPLTKPTINLPPGHSTVNYEAQAAQDDSEYQVLWVNTMEESNYQSSSKYTSVEVLLLCWAERNDDLTVTEEVSRLKATFEECFNYHAQIKYLDASTQQKLQVQVNRIVANFVGDFDGPNTLLIVYYAGHGKPGNYFGSLECFGQTSENDQQKRPDTLVWNKTEKLLYDACADVLEIFDCCYAGNLSLTRGEFRLFEFLGATKELNTTPVPGPDSFTSALIYALKELVREKGRFTTVELIRKIQFDAPDFPKNQTPILSNRKDGVQAGRIMLHPLHKSQKDGSQTELPSEENKNPYPFSRQTVTLHFEFAEKPSHANVQLLGRQLNNIFELYKLGVNRVRWGGMKQSAFARVMGSFQASLARSRRASLNRQLAALDIGATPLWAEKNSELLTPSSSSQHSPRALDFAATGSSSNEASDEDQISAPRLRNKKQTSDTDDG